MTCITVSTQKDLDAALKTEDACIRITSSDGVWLHLSSTGSATVRAYDSATVEAYDLATVQAYGSATVRAYGSATVYATGSATVEATGSATVRAYDLATVEAYDLATVRAYESATVEAYGSATVQAYGSATVQATGSPTVRAYDSATVYATGSPTVQAYDLATVRAYGSATVYATGSATVEATGLATVEAYDSATIQATPHVAIHLHHSTAKITGGVLIDVTKIDDTPEAWCEHHGITITDGKATLYKAVYDTWRTDRGTAWTYKPGTTVTATDYHRKKVCGGGLHLCPRPWMSKKYLPGATRYVACEVDIATLIPLGDKCKTDKVLVLHEVDLDGEQVTA